jgi:hypothetical protein
MVITKGYFLFFSGWGVCHKSSWIAMRRYELAKIKATL